MMRSALYTAKVMHHRVRPFRHRFVYRVFSLLLDVDEISGLGRRLRLFSHNRFNVLSFHDRDFGPRDGTPPRQWIESMLRDRGYRFPVGRIELLCYPRLWGYVFNPISIYWIHDTDDRLQAVLYEVTNTYKERRHYLLSVENEDGPVRQMCRKELYVSPFIGMDARYHFRLARPTDALNVAIREETPEGTVLFAAMNGTRKPLGDGALLRTVLAHPLMTIKVIAGIHWQALRLWQKGARVYAHDTPQRRAVSGERPDDANGREYNAFTN